MLYFLSQKYMADLIQNFPPEGWLLAGCTLVILTLLILLLIRNRKYRKLKQEWIGDKIKLEDSQEKEEWLKLLTRTIPKAFWIFDTRKTIFLSPAFRTLTGLEEKHVAKPRDIFRYMEPEFRDHCSELFDTFLVGEENRIQGKCRFSTHPDHWIQIEFFRVNDSHHSQYIVALLDEVTHQETTMRKLDSQKAKLEQIMQETQRDLIENQLLLKDILSSTDEGIYVLDRAFKVIFWNREMEKISGKTREEVLYKEEIWNLFPHLVKNKVAETIRSRIEQLRLVRKHDNFHLEPFTVSIGVAMLRSNESAESLFDRADALMYQAKREGRNRVMGEAA